MPGAGSAGQADSVVERVRAGYAFDGPAVELGALVVDGTAQPDVPVRLPVAMMNRHGLVAGAAGTGKTTTLQLMAEQLSAAGVPVFLADMKGDLSGIAAPGTGGDRVTARAADTGTAWEPRGCPVEFLALGGLGPGAAVRATVTGFGPLLLARVLGLNDVQESSLVLVFHYADEHGLPLLDLKDLRAVIAHLTGPEGRDELAALGGLSKATAGVILRELVALADQGGDSFFGEPEMDLAELLRTTDDGHGVVSVLELPAVQDRPALFSTFLMWLLAELFEELPEVGDVERPKLVFFFDEAHLLFRDASKDFLAAVTQTVRLIRSKGVGVFFVTQTPEDVPGDVLGQLGSRVQHALRAYTPADVDALTATVRTFPRSSYDLADLLQSLGIGEAVVTVLSETGAPTPVAWTRLRPPMSLMAPLGADELAAHVAGSSLAARYADPLDRESAYERLLQRVAPPPRRDAGDLASAVLGSSVLESFARAAAGAAGREIGRAIFGTARRRRRR